MRKGEYRLKQMNALITSVRRTELLLHKLTNVMTATKTLVNHLYSTT